MLCLHSALGPYLALQRNLSFYLSKLPVLWWKKRTTEWSHSSFFFFFCKPWTFYFVLGCSQLTKLWQFQVNREGTQPYICMNPFSPNLSSIQASTKHWVEFHVLSSRSLLVIHFKYSSVHVTFPNSLSLSPYSSFLKASTPTLRMMLRPWEKTQVHPRKSLPLLSTCQSNN